MAPPKKQRTPRHHGRPDRTESIPQRRQRNPVAEVLPTEVPAPRRSDKAEESQGKRKEGCGGSGSAAPDGELAKGVPCGQCHSTHTKRIYGAALELRDYLCDDCKHLWVDRTDVGTLVELRPLLGDDHPLRDLRGSPLHSPLLQLLALLEKPRSIRDLDSRGGFVELDLNISPPPSPSPVRCAKGKDVGAPHLHILADVACEMAAEEFGISLKVVPDGHGGSSSVDQNRTLPPAKQCAKGKEKLEFEASHGFDDGLDGTTSAGDGWKTSDRVPFYNMRRRINNPPGMRELKSVALGVPSDTAEVDDDDHPLREPEGSLLHSLYLVVLSYTEDGGVSKEDLVNYFDRGNMTAKWPYNWKEQVRVHLRSNRYFKACRRRGQRITFVVSANHDLPSSPKEIVVPRRRKLTN